MSRMQSHHSRFSHLRLSLGILALGTLFFAGGAAESMLFPTVDFSKQHIATLEETLLRMYTAA